MNAVRQVLIRVVRGLGKYGGIFQIHKTSQGIFKEYIIIGE